MKINIFQLKLHLIFFTFIALFSSCQNSDETIVRTGGILGERIKIYSSDLAMTKIIADSPKDYYFALGFVHAMQSISQMELQRRMALGSMSEIFGESATGLDILIRSLNFKEIAKRSCARLDKESLRKINQYLGGINSFLGSKPTLFNHLVFGEKLREWKAEDILTLFAFHSFTQNTQLIGKLDHLILSSGKEPAFKQYTLEIKKIFLDILTNPKGIKACNIFHKSGDGHFAVNFSSVGKLQLPSLYLFTQFHLANDSDNKHSIAGYFLPGLPFPIAGKTSLGATLFDFVSEDAHSFDKFKLSSDGQSVIGRDNNLKKVNLLIDSLSLAKSSVKYYRAEIDSGVFLLNYKRDFKEEQYYLSIDFKVQSLDISLPMLLNENIFDSTQKLITLSEESPFSFQIVSNGKLFRINSSKEDSLDFRDKEISNLLRQNTSANENELFLIASSKQDLIAKEILGSTIKLIAANKKLLTQPEISYLDSLGKWDGNLFDDNISRLFLTYENKLRTIGQSPQDAKHDRKVLKLVIEAYKYAVGKFEDYSFDISLDHIAKNYSSEIDFFKLKNIKFVASENSLVPFYKISKPQSDKSQSDKSQNKNSLYYGSVFNFSFNTKSNNMLAISLGGQSGELNSPHYSDQVYLWSAGAYSELLFSNKIEKYEKLDYLIWNEKK